MVSGLKEFHCTPLVEDPYSKQTCYSLASTDRKSAAVLLANIGRSVHVCVSLDIHRVWCGEAKKNTVSCARTSLNLPS